MTMLPPTRERIRQIEAKALRKLKHPSRSRVLRSFLDTCSRAKTSYQRSLRLIGVCPLSHTDPHDHPTLVDEPVPGLAGSVVDGVVAVEDPVRQVGLAQILPDVLDRVQLG